MKMKKTKSQDLSMSDIQKLADELLDFVGLNPTMGREETKKRYLKILKEAFNLGYSKEKKLGLPLSLRCRARGRRKAASAF